MRHGLDAAIAVLLIVLVVAVAANAISVKAASYAQAVELAGRQQAVIASSEFALTHCPPKGIAVCQGGIVRVNEVAELPELRTTGFCVKRLVLLNGNIKTAVFCQ